MTDGLRKSHLRKAPQVGLSEVGLPDIHLENAEDRYHNIRNIDFLVPTLAKPPNIWTSVPRVTIITNNVFSLSMQCLPIFLVAVHRGSPLGI